ncbi:MAG: hypothetical protein FWF73_01430 [Spirochaetes bacterium]|nr:hypothetical protein [Spirochaetota bacterium]
MSFKEYEFYLPIGYEDDKGVFHRKGKMRLATALDEIEINNSAQSKLKTRYRDCLLFSRVLESLGTLTEITPEIIENLYEADFIYLQMLYNKLNSDYNENVITKCPNCGHVNSTDLTDLFSELNFILEERESKI